MHTPKILKFTVDSALLRELGEKLVGQHHIALAELVKNAYDADASVCEIEFDGGSIIVRDNGLGMDERSFSDFWMRIGSTHKERWEVSPGGRYLTGAKGVGRLAVQFLAYEMTLRSTLRGDEEQELFARVDWAKAQQVGELINAEVPTFFRGRTTKYADQSTHGVEIVLTKLHHQWTDDDFRDLAREVWMLRPPFAEDGVESKDTFDIRLTAPSEVTEKEFHRILNATLDNWRARITCSIDFGRNRQEAFIRVEFKEGFGRAEAGTYKEFVPLPVKWRPAEDDEDLEEKQDCDEFQIDSLQFEILVYNTKNRQPDGISVAEMRKYLQRFGGVHIYDSGFHLPYYGINHDWLNLEYDHAHRRSISRLLPEKFQYSEMMHDLPTNGRLFGVVRVNTGRERNAAIAQGAPPGHVLTINIGRDRLLDNAAYRQVRALVRWSIDYYVSCYRRRKLESVDFFRDFEPPQTKRERIFEIFEENQRFIPPPVYERLQLEFNDYTQSIRKEEEYQSNFVSLLGPLATAGMVSLALNHEMGREVSRLDGIADRLREIANESDSGELRELAQDITDWAKRLRDIRRLFTPLADEEDRRNLEHYRAAPLLRDIRDGLEPFLAGSRLEIGDISNEFRLPPAPYADWNALFQNVFMNALNAMLDTPERRIRVTAGRTGRKGWVRVSDTGCGLGVPIHEANILFEPFERRLNISNERRALGLGGHGLGLTIVRMIASNRDCRVAFVQPEEGFSTTFELAWGV